MKVGDTIMREISRLELAPPGEYDQIKAPVGSCRRYVERLKIVSETKTCWRVSDGGRYKKDSLRRVGRADPFVKDSIREISEEEEELLRRKKKLIQIRSVMDDVRFDSFTEEELDRILNILERAGKRTAAGDVREGGVG